MYRLFQLGPDNRSTYPECWGSTAVSNGRLVADGEMLTDLAGAVEGLGHDNFCIIEDDGSPVAGSRKEFWAALSGDQPESQICPECRGRGGPCHLCHGAGFVRERT